jgi:hypothetical protein
MAGKLCIRTCKILFYIIEFTVYRLKLEINDTHE